MQCMQGRLRADSGIATLSDLKDKKKSATKGSSSESLARALISEANILTFQDSASAFLALRQEKVSALVRSELPLFRFKQEAGEGLDYIQNSVAYEFWGLAVRKDDGDFSLS